MGDIRRAWRSFREDRQRMGRVGGVERSPEIPCMVHFRPWMGAKTGAGQREVTRVEETVVEHMTLITEVQGDVENLIAGARTSANIKDALRIEVTGLRHLVSQLLRWVTALEGRQEHPIEVEDNLEEEEESSEDEAPVPVPVWALGVMYQLVPIEDLAEEEEEDSEIEEGLAIEIAALDPAPAYSK